MKLYTSVGKLTKGYIGNTRLTLHHNRQAKFEHPKPLRNINHYVLLRSSDGRYQRKKNTTQINFLFFSVCPFLSWGMRFVNFSFPKQEKPKKKRKEKLYIMSNGVSEYSPYSFSLYDLLAYTWEAYMMLYLFAISLLFCPYVPLVTFCFFPPIHQSIINRPFLEPKTIARSTIQIFFWN